MQQLMTLKNITDSILQVSRTKSEWLQDEYRIFKRAQGNVANPHSKKSPFRKKKSKYENSL